MHRGVGIRYLDNASDQSRSSRARKVPWEGISGRASGEVEYESGHDDHESVVDIIVGLRGEHHCASSRFDCVDTRSSHDLRRAPSLCARHTSVSCCVHPLRAANCGGRGRLQLCACIGTRRIVQDHVALRVAMDQVERDRPLRFGWWYCESRVLPNRVWLDGSTHPTDRQ